MQNLAVLRSPDDQILITLRESSWENWGIRGGDAVCDANLGFKADI